ncbi:E3 ubiquitin-protein ligase Topors [Stylophora pistillata]|uniref:E3 ubiquitin-protein ligase Topors n=1 Tax=Stylophora pistillata TaxID=50429 RepID=A0A2B4RIT0_STYPI|nr:E3 ubiquitin-protein ligase Topors [Stylophora pistillata]
MWVELSSEEFSRQLQPFLFEQTDHFIHEFVGFARSPFDMTAYDERAQYNWQNDTGQELRDTPTVFHSQTSGWQTPVPGPSGESLSLTDWRGDSPALQTENNSWSPSSSPGTSGLNGRAGLETAVTIFSSNSSATSHTTQVDVELTINDEASNTVSHSNGHRNRKRSSKKTVVEVTPVVPEKKKHQHHHYHRHSHKHKHKHKHKRKEPKRSNDKSNRSKLFGDTNTVEWGSAPSFSTRPSVYSSEFCSPPPEFIVVSSDTSASPVTPTVRPGSACNNPTQFQRRKGGSRSHSNSGSRPLSQRKGGFQEDKRLRRQSGHVKPRSRDRSLSVEERVIKEHHRGRSNTSEKRLKADSERLSPSRKSGKHRREKMRKSSLRPSHSYCQRTKRGEKIQNRRTKEYARSRSSSESTSRNSRSRHSRSQKSRTRNSRSREPRSRSRGPQSSKSESRESRTRNSHSRSRDSQDSQDSRSHSQSRHFSREYTSLLSRRHHSDSRSRRSSISSAKSEPSVRELAPNSNEDALKKEIVDLESRIVADKKRLLRLLMKKEQAEAV